MSFRLVIFDFDGTLADTRRLVVATMRDVLAEMALPVAEESSCMATIGMPLRRCYAQLVPWLSAEQLDQCYDAHQRLFDKNLQVISPALFPNVESTLSVLAAHKIQLSVASSRSTRSLLDLIRRLHLDGCFKYVVGADDVEHHKPHPDAVLKTLEALDVDRDEALVVGDTVLDIAMGRDAAVATCGVTYGIGTREQLVGEGATYVVDSVAAIRPLVLP